MNLAKSLRTPFLQNTSGRLPLLLAFPWHFTKMGALPTVFGKPQTNTFSRNTELRSTVQVAQSFLSHNFSQHKFSVCFYWFTQFTVRSSHQRCSLKKGVLRNFTKITRKTPVPESLF